MRLGGCAALDCAAKLVRQEGIGRLWVGGLPWAMRVGPILTIQWLVIGTLMLSDKTFGFNWSRIIMFVPSLSWQMIIFTAKGIKRRSLLAWADVLQRQEAAFGL